LHDSITGLLNEVDIILFGRKTYQLMESYWANARNDSRSTESEKYFADIINPATKIAFSKTLDSVNWLNSRLSKKDLIEEVSELKKQSGKNILVGNLSLTSQLLTTSLIDEYYFLLHPVL
jgi:dihydrofolate reductase